MVHRGVRRWKGTLLLLGTIIGAGIFGVPSMIGVWGIVPFTGAFVVLTAVTLTAHLYYAEALIANKRHSRLAGQAKHWLGRGPSWFAGVVQALQIFGSNLAYIILGGEFIAVIAIVAGVEVPLLYWQVAFWLIGGIFVLYGLRLVTRVESFLTWLLVAVIVILVAVFTTQLDFTIIFNLPSSFSFEPYGVILYAILGATSLPEVAEVVHYRREDMHLSVIRGTLAAAILTYGFGITAWLASGGALGRDPAEVVLLLPPVLQILIPIFGLLAVMTSFIASALDLRNMFHVDYHFSNAFAWVVALGTPLALLFLTARDFLTTIGLVGSVFGATVALLSVLMGRAALRRRKRRIKWCTLWCEVVPGIVVIFLLLGGVAWILVK
ncbi:hypothetical protein GF380_03910 [Candidatus Uhrbacteria bacterium]|nr:hypothetical protein [Candidatus Uhrbacteria bacterium]MBD3284239.1 hypothetical protein [Candidatus Uhrbacteria bacterium]